MIARLDAVGCARYVITDVDKDGLLAGPNLALLHDACAATVGRSSLPAASPSCPISRR